MYFWDVEKNGLEEILEFGKARKLVSELLHLMTEL